MPSKEKVQYGPELGYEVNWDEFIEDLLSLGSTLMKLPNSAYNTRQ